MFRRVLYVSTARGQWSEGLATDLSDIVIKCSRFNIAHGVTGLLSFRRGHFLQVLEGAPEDIGRLYARIQNDPRHTDILTLIDEQSEGRQFASWSYRLSAESAMNQDFQRFVTLHRNELRRPRLQAAVSILRDFHDPDGADGAFATFPGLDEIRGYELRLLTFPSSGRLSPQHLDVLAVMVEGWVLFDVLCRRTRLKPDVVHRLLRDFQAQKVLACRIAQSQSSTAKATVTQPGFYARLRSFFLNAR